MSKETLESLEERSRKLKQEIAEKKREERKRQRKEEQRRNYLVGEYVIEYFPEVKKYAPQRSNADSREAFQDLIYLLKQLSGEYRDFFYDLIRDIQNQRQSEINQAHLHVEGANVKSEVENGSI